MTFEYINISVEHKTYFLSSAINKILKNVLKKGVYLGFDVSLNNLMTINVGAVNQESTAMVESGSYLLSVQAKGQQTLTVPIGNSTLVIEVVYDKYTETTYDVKVISSAMVTSEHVILADFNVPDNTTTLTAGMIDLSRRNSAKVSFGDHNHDTDYLAKSKQSEIDTAQATADSKWSFILSSLTQYGAVKLSNAINSTSEVLAATPKAVKLAYDKAVLAYNIANTKLDSGSTAVNSDRLGNQLPDYYKDIPARLGYKPVHQGGGAGQGTNEIYIGWSGSNLRLQVDSTNFSEEWPITSDNANNLDGQPLGYFAKSADVKTPVPLNAKFTDTNTWRSISDSLASTSNSVSASSKAVKNLQDNKLAKTAKAADSQKLDNLDSSQFLRSDANDNLTAALIVPDANRNQGVFGTYNSSKTQHIWSMGTSYRNAANGANYGNLYGAAYSNNSVGDGQAKAGSHQFVWCHNGVAKCALGSNLWTSGFVYEQNQLLSARYLGKTATAANASKVANLTVKQVIKKSIATYYSTGNITISLGDAIEHRVMRWGSGNGTITITGTPTKGDKILIDNIRDSSGKATITGKTMYTPDGANASTHTLTGKGQVEFACYDGSKFMMTRAVG
ncbi:tail fiber protein [Pseudoalteromonas sp. C2R02]|uniref:phage tail protein n=1 Tax=Pseudoalteromonas sp. C2R02 TaxID=2841565 RepID=UPI001C087DB7|nr:phage tail protein [Pseudoalteromonas sp. C2R02]MBU2968797.1 tail fiber protein [Pseudoalteromonas sp. C2R02]